MIIKDTVRKDVGTRWVNELKDVKGGKGARLLPKLVFVPRVLGRTCMVCGRSGGVRHSGGLTPTVSFHVRWFRTRDLTYYP